MEVMVMSFVKKIPASLWILWVGGAIWLLWLYHIPRPNLSDSEFFLIIYSLLFMYFFGLQSGREMERYCTFRKDEPMASQN